MPLRLIALPLIPLALMASAACSFQFCNDGMFPFDGQTNVALDTEVTINLVAALPKDAPALRNAISFVDLTTDEAVPFDASYDRDAGVVTVTPLQLLEDGHDYEVVGVSRRFRDNAHHIDNDSFFSGSGVGATRAIFSTASGPEIVAASYVDGVATIQFSEPMDPPALATLMTWGLDTPDGEVLLGAIPLGVQDGAGFVFAWGFEAETEEVDIHRLFFEAEWLPARSGAGLVLPRTEYMSHHVDSVALSRVTEGLASCGGF